MPPAPDSFLVWHRALVERFRPLVSLPDLRRGVQALSTAYVQRRDRIARGHGLDSTAKRAAFAVFYAPIHFLTVREVVRALGTERGGGEEELRLILDLGCGTGASGAAWAHLCGGSPRLEGVDLHPWAVSEARWTYGALSIRGRAWRGDVQTARLPRRGGGVLAAYSINELPSAARDVLLARLARWARGGGALLIVEPISRAVTPWWDVWARELEPMGARGDDWRFEAQLPPELEELDRAAGLDHRELTARSLWVPPSRDRQEGSSDDLEG